MRYFAVFCRVALALGFIPSGIVKVMGERFTALPSNHPLGHYFDALHLTGFYYTFIGVSQLTVAVLLLIPRTALLGAILYFPIIFNICVLAYATRFEGTRITTLMVLANLYLLCWDYARLKYVLPFASSGAAGATPDQTVSRKFPWVFFGGVVAVVAAVIVINAFMYDIRPGNSQLECTNGCRNNARPEACQRFCNCIYNEGKTLADCLEEYEKKKE
ncbi:MAG: DoxX family protein [Acidobacteria bacterium]|nr:DoxX family protein [Acidobacteriota bacterium]